MVQPPAWNNTQLFELSADQLCDCSDFIELSIKLLFNGATLCVQVNSQPRNQLGSSQQGMDHSASQRFKNQHGQHDPQLQLEAEQPHMQNVTGRQVSYQRSRTPPSPDPKPPEVLWNHRMEWLVHQWIHKQWCRISRGKVRMPCQVVNHKSGTFFWSITISCTRGSATNTE
jgi:hypothetical protein